jgi:hypothetical protein
MRTPKPHLSEQPPEQDVAIYFSDFFGVSPQLLEDYGAFDVSLVNDLPLFVDPFLLFYSENPEYKQLHDEIIRYLLFLREISRRGVSSEAELKLWFYFREVKENWLGFSAFGNGGSGLGGKFARELHSNLASVFKDFGQEKIARGRHLEKLCLVSPGVGRDNISDFTVCLIKNFLLEYTQAFAVEHLHQEQLWTGMVERAWFDFEKASWRNRQYTLPRSGASYVILTPKDILTREQTWISRKDFLQSFDHLAASLPDDELRAKLNRYLREKLVFAPDATEKEREQKRLDVLDQAIRDHPELIDYYIREKEDNGDKAVDVSNELVSEAESRYVDAIRDFATLSLLPAGFYDLPPVGSLKEAMSRLLFFKDVIENQGGYRFFYDNDDKPIRRESDLQLIYKLTWFSTPYNVDSEVNNGSGPVDFKISYGRDDVALVEFKLASNTSLPRNLKNQLRTYQTSNRGAPGIWAICFFSLPEFQKVDALLKELEVHKHFDVVLIDCRKDNKPSGSKA